jgi:2-dehydropantoate 2-reductase
MDKKIAVLGTGAIGSSVAADLTKAEYDVTIIDQWAEHVEAMKEKGLHIKLPDMELKVPVKACHLYEMASLYPQFDIVFLCVKSYDRRWMVEFIEPYLKSDGVLVGLQNSLNDDSHAGILGRERVVGCAIELSAEIFTPGIVQRNTTHTGTWFGIGELDGSITPRVKELQEILSHVAKVDITQNIYGSRWTKLLANSMTMGPYGLLGIKNAEAVKMDGMLEIQINLGKESMEVGTALGYNIEPIFGLNADDFAGSDDQVLMTAMKTLMSHVGTRARTAPIQDHIKGRRSEMEYINGLVSSKGREVGIPTPYNDAVTEIARMIDMRELKMDVSNFELLKAKIVESL